jgi:CheY-like chemotaxis protein
MPNMSGVEVARALRAYPSNIYIVGCTGNALREDQDEYLAAGADVIITKPIHQSAVMEKLKHARERAWLTSLG